jgi:predicted nucleic acid-binding protein
MSATAGPCVVDASVAIKWFVPEPLQAQAWTLAAAPQDLIAPDLLLVEVVNIAWKKQRLGEIDAIVAREIARRIRRGLGRVFPSDALIGPALDIALALRHPVYDCLYLALAERSGYPLVSADARLLRLIAGTRWHKRVLPLAAIPPLPAA